MISTHQKTDPLGPQILPSFGLPREFHPEAVGNLPCLAVMQLWVKKEAFCWRRDGCLMFFGGFFDPFSTTKMMKDGAILRLLDVVWGEVLMKERMKTTLVGCSCVICKWWGGTFVEKHVGQPFCRGLRQETSQFQVLVHGQFYCCHGFHHVCTCVLWCFQQITTCWPPELHRILPFLRADHPGLRISAQINNICHQWMVSTSKKTKSWWEKDEKRPK